MIDWLPDPGDLKNHFAKSLNLLSNCEPFCNPIFPDYLGDQLGDKLLENEAEYLRERPPEDWYFQIDPNWQFLLQDNNEPKDAFNGADAMAIIGGEVKVKDGKFLKITFNLSLLLREGYKESRGTCNVVSCCLDNYSEQWRVVRRFSFDFNTGDREKDGAPTSHIEYGRKFQKSKTKGIEPHYCLDRRIYKPRIPFPPLDFIILLDLLIDQYENMEDIRDKDWDGQVIKSEELLWGNYFSEISRHLDGTRAVGGETSEKRILHFLANEF